LATRRFDPGLASIPAGLIEDIEAAWDECDLTQEIPGEIKGPALSRLPASTMDQFSALVYLAMDATIPPLKKRKRKTRLEDRLWVRDEAARIIVLDGKPEKINDAEVFAYYCHLIAKYPHRASGSEISTLLGRTIKLIRLRNQLPRRLHGTVETQRGNNGGHRISLPERRP
jgi:hypothetical protein